MWGAGTYYIAELDDDMVSLRTNPEMVVINDDSGNQVPTADKSCVFLGMDGTIFHGGINMLCREDLRDLIDLLVNSCRGHASVFEFKGKWYAIQEKSETNIFIEELKSECYLFNQDGTIIFVPRRK